MAVRPQNTGRVPGDRPKGIFFPPGSSLPRGLGRGLTGSSSSLTGLLPEVSARTQAPTLWPRETAVRLCQGLGPGSGAGRPWPPAEPLGRQRSLAGHGLLVPAPRAGSQRRASKGPLGHRLRAWERRSLPHVGGGAEAGAPSGTSGGPFAVTCRTGLPGPSLKSSFSEHPRPLRGGGVLPWGTHKVPAHQGESEQHGGPGLSEQVC